MTKINASTGIAIFFGVVALLLYWMKADRNAILLEVFFLIYGAILLAQVVRKKMWTHRWGYSLLTLAVLIVLQAMLSLWTSEFYWQGIIIPLGMYAVIYRKVYPKETLI